MNPQEILERVELSFFENSNGLYIIHHLNRRSEVTQNPLVTIYRNTVTV